MYVPTGVRQLTSASSHRSSVAGKAIANAQEKEVKQHGCIPHVLPGLSCAKEEGL